MDPIEQEMLETMGAAVDAGGVPIAMIPYDGPPPDGEFYLALLRDMIVTTGEATGALTFGTSNRTSGMFPLINVDPQEGLKLLIFMRQQGLIGDVSWITLAADSYRRKFGKDTKPEDIHKGDLEQMAKAGDAEVEEVIMVSCMAPDGPGYDISQPYKRTPTGIEWGEIEHLDPKLSVQGAIHDLMTELVTA